MMKEIKNNELKKISGGAAGYGNVQFRCSCGYDFIKPKNLLEHCYSDKMHKTAKMYEQKKEGKSSRGKYIGTVKISKDSKNKRKMILTYPNGKKESKICSDGDSISNWDLIN